MFREVKKNFRKLSLLLLVVTAAFLLWGCSGGGGSSYDTPTSTQTATPLIDAETLKGWMDDGLVNADEFENVVILDIGAPDATKIPGAYYWNTSELAYSREEGLAMVDSEVPPGDVMDTVLQRSGVNEYTTIVLSSSNSKTFYVPRAYYTLRYWGFPKDRIKVLNGFNAGWTAAIAENGWDSSYALTTERPLEDTTNTFSVADNGYLCDDLRYSIGEIIQVVDANNEFDDDENINIIAQADEAPNLKSSIARPYGDMFEDDDTDGATYFRPKAELEAIFLNNELPNGDLSGVGDFTPGQLSITHCSSGMSCTPLFFALDAILGWDAAVWDGSRNQWYAYMDRPTEAEAVADVNAAGGELFVDKNGSPTGYESFDADDDDGRDAWLLVVNDAWRTDLNDRTNAVAYSTAVVNDGSVDRTVYVGNTVIIPENNTSFQEVDDPRANQIENEDNDYMSAGQEDAPSELSSDASEC
ncbi:3-mercaptopyruvate sulfurtransferase SseA, contains two rhodanese domains [Desulfuromusa kysingii]|uniref:3-mercaptopyruvate sulfurtransferase SseA, contains two rhodanese domains n=1 Tax=Desulfuromusa kysingii TaxID=37625 RepID=A0A1H4CQU3_9BACT|nr:selenite/tellurite reduction operon rhodanese-like protein ExtH [Desulfuromusa kysingii]SEA62776.1 3-mercaptopyruvate sulfurtransferase SseA, contains two rhodanese domains [Desulfuromusa kysingii]